MHLFLVRHGETEENQKGIIQGQYPGHLSANGLKQSQDLANKLSSEKFNAIFSSDLQRCVDTATMIAKYHKDIPLIFSPELRDFYYGRLQGISLGSFGRDLGSSRVLSHVKFPGAESRKTMKLRLTKFLDDVYKKYPNGTVLIVTHAGPIRIIRVMLDRNVSPFDKQLIANDSVWEVEMTSKLLVVK